MATYLAGSNVQADAMQTLYLVNPGYVGYADASNTGNMVLISPSTGMGQVNPLTNSSHQQHYIGSLAGHQNSSVNLFTSHPGNQTYNSWTEAGELSFLPSNDVNQVPPSLGSRITALNSGQQASLIQNGGSLGLNMENSQASAGPGQGLSLSLSTQQSSVIGQLQTFHMQPSESGISSCAGMPHATSEDTTNRGERFPNKWVGNLSSFRASSRDGALAGFSSNPTGSSRHAHLESGAPEVTGGLLNGSKYLKAAQQLLDEVVSVGRGLKSSSTKNTKLQSWKGTGSMVEGSVSKDRQLSDMDDKDGVAGDTAAPTSAPEQNNDPVSELSPTQRQELQLKKAKLTAMVDEVDRRYRQYYNQMQIVVTSFESAAGLGAAKTYTALALQTISRHFRCLRDAISGQIRLASRALGEEDLARQNSGKGETSRLRYVDQQLRQQRALQQLGMMQQHAWRPQRGLPERSVSVLRAWLFEHFLHPYPKDSDKIMLARQTGLTRSQVSNWFINARVRLWKPMVEEMYVEETREAEMEAGSGKGRQEFENMNKGVGVIDAAGNPSSRQANGDANKMVAEQQNASDDFPETVQASNQSKPNTSPGCDPRSLGPGPKKARQDSGSLLSPNTSMDADLRSEGTRSEGRSEVENKQSFTISHNELVRAENLGGFGSYQIEGLNRNSHAGLAPRYPASSGVSLTLGLQHCEGLSLSGAQAQQYLQGQGRRLDAAASNANEFYGINHQASAAPYSSNYDATNNLQNRKRLATQLFPHNFVA